MIEFAKKFIVAIRVSYGITISVQASDAINYIAKKAFRLILTDLELQDKSGINVIHIARKSQGFPHLRGQIKALPQIRGQINRIELS